MNQRKLAEHAYGHAFTRNTIFCRMIHDVNNTKSDTRKPKRTVRHKQRHKEQQQGEQHREQRHRRLAPLLTLWSLKVFPKELLLQSSRMWFLWRFGHFWKHSQKCCPCHHFWHCDTFGQTCHCDASKLHLGHVTKCCVCHEIGQHTSPKCRARNEKTTRQHWLVSKVLRLPRKTRHKHAICQEIYLLHVIRQTLFEHCP